MADSGKRIMDQGWVKIQQKTFAKWINNHLVKKYGKEAALDIDTLETQFDTGANLMKLLSSLYGKPLPKYNKNPKMKPHLLDNCTTALNMLEKDVGVKTNFLKTNHLVDHDLKMILGMIWAIILHYQIQGISVEELSAKEGLLLWCQKKTKGYKDVDPPKIRGFTTDWQNGLAFCALIHKHRPDLIDYDSLSKDNARENLELAFSVAEKELNIPRLLDVEDLVDVARPDERSVITYVSEYFHCFASYGEAEAAGKRIAALVANAKANQELKEAYNTKASGLKDWIVAKTEDHKDRDFGDSLESVEGKLGEFSAYRKDEKPPKTKEKLDLAAELATLQTKLKVQGRPQYTPPAGLGTDEIDGLWTTLGEEETNRVAALRKELERQQRIKALVDRFTRRADALDAWAKSNLAFTNKTDTGSDLASVQAHLKTLEGFEADFKASDPRLESVKAIGQELIDLGYSGASTVQDRMGQLDASWAALRQSADARKAALEEELARQQRLEDLRLDFGTRGRVFINWIENADLLNETTHFNALSEIESFAAQFDSFKQEKEQQQGEYDSLVQLSQTMADEGITDNVYAVYSMDDITARWNKVNSDTDAIAPAIASERERLQEDDKLCQEFATKAGEFTQWAEEQRAALAAVSGEPADQVEELSKKRAELRGEQGRVDDLVSLDHQLAQRGVMNNPHSSADANSLKLEYDAVLELAGQQISTLEKEMAAAQASSGVDPEQMAEFKEMFTHFDKDDSNTLEKHEFKACLSSLGISKNDAEIDQIMADVAGGSGSIRFDSFAEYIAQVYDKSDTAENMREAFKTVSGGKDYITEADLRSVLDADTVDFLLANMEKGDDGYSYEQWVNAQYVN